MIFDPEELEVAPEHARRAFLGARKEADEFGSRIISTKLARPTPSLMWGAHPEHLTCTMADMERSGERSRDPTGLIRLVGPFRG